MTFNLKIIILFLLGFVLLGLYLYLGRSPELNELLQKAERARTDWAFGIYVTIGLAKLASLIAGISIPLILTFLLVKRNIENKAS